MKKILLIIFILMSIMIFQFNIEAAIALDASSMSGITMNTDTVTWAHTCTGDNRILFVGFFSDAVDSVTGVKYNDVSLTLIDKIQVHTDRYIYLYYLIAPATGEHNIVCSGSDSKADWNCIGVSYTGAKQSAQPDEDTTDGGDATYTDEITTTLTTVADNCWTILVGKNTVATPTAGTGSTLRQGDSGIGVYDSNGVITPAGETSMQITHGSNAYWGTVMASFTPVSEEEEAADNAIMFGMNF